MLEDRVTQRTQAGQDTNEFDPTGGTHTSVACLHLTQLHFWN